MSVLCRLVAVRVVLPECLTVFGPCDIAMTGAFALKLYKKKMAFVIFWMLLNDLLTQFLNYINYMPQIKYPLSLFLH